MPNVFIYASHAVNTVSLTQVNSAADVDADAACFHCGLPVPDGASFKVRFDGRVRPLCCAGCEAVAQTIFDSGLGDYYQTRSRFPQSPANTVPQTLRELARYDLPGIREHFVAATAEDSNEALLSLDGMTCAACAWLIEQRLHRLPGVVSADVNYSTQRARIRWQPAQLALSCIVATIGALGITAYPAEQHADAAREAKARKRALWEIFVAAFAMMQVMMYTVPMYFADPGEVSADIRQLMQWAGLALTIPVLLFSARPIFRAAWSALAAGVVAMDVPIALAILLTFIASTWAMVSGASGTGEVYFDAIIMFVLLLSLVRFIDADMRRKRLAALERILKPIPTVAERLDNYPQQRTGADIATASLQRGDVIRIATGAIVPADGEIIEGSGEVDEALLSGESRPVSKQMGDALIGGSINSGAPLLARVTAVGAATVLAGIVRASDIALATRPKIERLVTAAAARLSYATLLLAAAAALLWLFIDPARAFGVTVAVLAITCPCALALAIPAVTAASGGALARAGLIVQHSRLLDALPKVSDLVIDKTGTLTTGRMRIAEIRLDMSAGQNTRSENQILAIAAAIEAGSNHPIALALRKAATARGLLLPQVSNACFNANGIAGVSGNIGDRDWSIGVQASGAAVESKTHRQPFTQVVLRCEQHDVATILLEDEMRSDAQDFIKHIKQRGMRVHLLSGDQEDAVRFCAETLGIDASHARMTPDDKRAFTRALQAKGAVVLAIGDGINEAPLLAQADAGIAIAQGADLARARADAILTGSRLLPVATAIGITQQAARIVRQNLYWAFAYNAICIPLALAGLVTPWLAAAGMSTSSLLVTLNAARLLSRRAATHTGTQA